MPDIDNVSHNFLLDVYHEKVFLLKADEVRYAPPTARSKNESASNLLV